jgi:hypothetical protein
MLKTGVGGAALLFGARVANGFSRKAARAGGDSSKFLFLTENDRETVAAIAQAMLEGALPQVGTTENAEAIVEIVRGVDKAVSGLTPSVQAEARDLFDILDFPVTRATIAGVWMPWMEADIATISKFLNSWRKSRFQLLRSGYGALHELITASWYGNPLSWKAIGYSGPPDVATPS